MPPATFERLTTRLELSQLDPEHGTFRGIASVFGNIVDAWIPTIIHKGAFAKTIQERKPKIKILWQHNLDDPIGIPTMLREIDVGLELEARITLTDRTRHYMALMKDGVVDALSIGWDPVKWEMEDRGQGDVMRHVRECRLWEISPVTWGADDKAMILEVQAIVPYQDLPLADRERDWDRDAAESRIRTWAGVDETPNARYRRAFVYYDADAPDLFGSYKLPIADILDNKLTAVPKGLFAAAAAIQGARGGVNIPDTEIPRAKGHLARYYRKMATAFDDDTIKPPWEQDAPLLDHLEYFEPATRLWAIGQALHRVEADDAKTLSRAVEALMAYLPETHPLRSSPSNSTAAPAAEPPAAESNAEAQALTAQRLEALRAAELTFGEAALS